MANLETLELTINANAQSASKGIASLIGSLSALSEALVKPFNDLKNLNNALTALRSNAKIKFDVSGSVGQGSSARKTAKKVAAIPEDYDWGNNRAVNRASDTFSQAQYDADFKKAGEAFYARMNADSARNAEWRSRWQSAVSSGKNVITNADVRVPTDEEIEKLNNATREGAKDQKSFWQSIKETGTKLKDVIPKFKLLSKTIKMATTMLLRMAIRAFFKGAVEGYKNYYEYAKATGNSLATEMDKINNSWQQIKNQMGASLASVFSAFIPVLNSLANAAITAFNYVSQLLALLTGKGSWSKASEVSTSLDEVGKSAGGAGGKVKELLADFDELNVIASESGGGGGGSAAADATEMFEEVYEFDSRIRALVGFIRDNMESIKGIAIAIGTAILAWKFADAFAETLPVLSKLFGMISTGAVIAITLQVTWMLTNQYLDTGTIGWLIADVFTTAVGATAAAAIAQHFIGGNAGAWTAAITLTFSAVTGIVALVGNSDVSAISKEGLAVSVENALKVGAAAAVLSHMTGASVGMALKGGAVVALATFGAIVAIKATADVQTYGITANTIKADIIASIALGSAAGLLAVIGGASAGAAAALAGIGAVASFAVIIAIQAITDANHVKVDENLVKLTQEQANKFVKSQMFSIDPTITIKITSGNIKNLQMKEEEISDKLAKMMGTLEVVKLGLATSDDYGGLLDQITGEGGLIDTVNSWIDEAKESGKLVLKFTPKIAGETEEEQAEWYTQYEEGWNTVQGFMNKLGQELADEFVKGENDELIVKRPERVQAILDEIAKISAIIAGTDKPIEAELDLELKLKDLDSSSFNEAMKLFGEYKKQIKSAVDEFVETAYKNQGRLVEALKKLYELAETPEEKAALKEQLDAAEAVLAEMKEDWDDRVKEQMDEWTAPGKSMLEEWLKSNFEAGSFKIPWTSEYFKDLINTSGFEEALREIFESNGMDTTNLDISDILEVGGWDLLADDVKANLLKAITPDDDTILLLKDACGLSASDIITMSDWDNFSTLQRIQMVTSLVNAFGVSDAKKALEAVGMTIDELIGEGLGKGGNTKEAAEKLQKIIQDALSKKPTLADPTAPTTWGQKVKDKATNLFKKIKETLTKAVSIKNPTTPTTWGNRIKEKTKTLFANVKKVLTGALKTSDVTTPAKYGKDAIGETSKVHYKMANDIDDPLQSSDVTTPIEFGKNVLSSAKTLMDNLKKTLQEKLYVEVGIKSDGSYVRITQKPVGNNQINVGGETITPYATGAFGIKNGQIFIANERGPELVGTIGNQNAVANQGQIVEGISKGVQNANAEQNALLRQQNALLQSILEKDNSVRLTASSALGRTVRQSLNMYGAVTGG